MGGRVGIDRYRSGVGIDGLRSGGVRTVGRRSGMGIVLRLVHEAEVRRERLGIVLRLVHEVDVRREGLHFPNEHRPVRAHRRRSINKVERFASRFVRPSIVGGHHPGETERRSENRGACSHRGGQQGVAKKAPAGRWDGASSLALRRS